MILADPALGALRRGFPDARLSVLCVPRALQVLESCPYVDHVFPFDQQALLSGPLPSRLKRLVRSVGVIARLRMQHFDVVLNLHQLYSTEGAKRIRLLLRSIAAKRTYGRNTEGRGGFYMKSVPDPPMPESVHEVEMNLRVVRLLGIEAPLAEPKFWLSSADRENATGMLPASWREKPRPIVAICAGAEASDKRWRPERFVAVGMELVRRFGARIVLVGGKADLPLLPCLSQLLSTEAVSLIAKASLGELAAVLESCTLIITNDSGPMHIAAAVGTPAVAIFGPGWPGRFGPVGMRHIVLRSHAISSPCEDISCRRVHCLDWVTTEQVLKAAAAVLKSQAEPSRCSPS